MNDSNTDQPDDHCNSKILKSFCLLSYTTRPVKEHPFFKPIGRGVKVNSQAKQIILNVLFHIRVIRPKESVNSVVALTSKFTGVSERTIYRLKSEKEQFEHTRNLDDEKSEPKNIAGESRNDTQSQSNHTAEFANEFDDQNLSTDKSVPKVNRLKCTSTSKSRTKLKDPPSPRAERKKFTKPTQKRLAKIDPVTISKLKAKVNDCLQWKNKPQPTVNQIMEIVNEDPSLPNYKRSTFWRIMCDLGFQKPKRGAGKRKPGKKTKTAGKTLNHIEQPQAKETTRTATVACNYTQPIMQNTNNIDDYVCPTASTPFQDVHKPAEAFSGYINQVRTCYYASTTST